MYVYVFVYIHMYTYIYRYIHIYICIYIYMYLCIYMYMWSRQRVVRMGRLRPSLTSSFRQSRLLMASSGGKPCLGQVTSNFGTWIVHTYIYPCTCVYMYIYIRRHIYIHIYLKICFLEPRIFRMVFEIVLKGARSTRPLTRSWIGAKLYKSVENCAN